MNCWDLNDEKGNTMTLLPWKYENEKRTTYDVFTGKPTITEEHFIYNDKDSLVAVVNNYRETSVQNAILIAAAPTMYNALVEVDRLFNCDAVKLALFVATKGERLPESVL